MDRPRAARSHQEPVFVGPVAVQDVDQRIDGTIDAVGPLAADFIMEMGARGPTGVPHGGQTVAPLDPLSGFDQDLAVVAVDGDEAAAVLYDDDVPVAPPGVAEADRDLAGEGNDTLGRGIDGGLDGRREVDSGVEFELL